MTARKYIGYGLIAGLSLEETLAAAPGFVADMYIMRRKYDDEQNGIKRNSATAWKGLD